MTRERGARDAIRAAALRLFATVGYEGASVDHIVAEAGVTKGAMYHHFRSKNELLFDIYERLIELQSASLARIVASAGSGERRLWLAAHEAVASTIAAHDEVAVFLRSRHLLSLEQQDTVAAKRASYTAAFRALYAEAAAEGAVRSDVSAVVVESYLFGAVQYLSEWYDPAGSVPPAELATQYADLFLASVRNPAAVCSSDA